MPKIAFECISGGISSINGSIVTLAISPPDRVYSATGSGEGQTWLLGAATSAQMGGVTIPETDDSGRSFPASLPGKTIAFSIEGGLSLRSHHRITIAIYSLEGSQSKLYEWSGRVPLTSNFIGGFSVEGTVRAMSDSHQRRTYNRIMWGNSDDDAVLIEAAGRGRARR